MKKLLLILLLSNFISGTVFSQHKVTKLNFEKLFDEFPNKEAYALKNKIFVNINEN